MKGESEGGTLVDDASFDEFVRGNLPALKRYAYALTGDRHAAEDLLQDTLVKVAAGWRRVRRDGNPVGYATAVMFRTHVSAWRHRMRRPGQIPLVDEPVSAGDPYASVDARVLLRVALRKLPRTQHAVLVATYLGDMDDDEIAVMIGRSPVTVRSLRYRGLRALQAGLADRPGLDGKEAGHGDAHVAVA